MDSPCRFQAEKRASHLPRGCLACPHYPLCKGGCRLEALSSTGNLYGKTTLCGDYRHLLAHIEKRLSREKGDLEDWLLGLYHRSGM
jgi:sulfatase maturation enzyme AslB (radical SAM superfamily)